MRLPRLHAFAVAALALTGAFWEADAAAQSANCRNLQAQIASLSRGDPARANTFARAAQKQRGELDRTIAYANSIGCQKRQFLIFGEAAPPQCGALNARIQSMRGNLASLDDQAGEAAGGSPGAIRALNARFNAECRAPQPSPQIAAAPSPRQRSLFDELFGVRPGPLPPSDFPPAQQEANLRRVPLEPVQSPLDDGEEEDGVRRGGGSKAVCVRKCDGGFFPVSYSARSRNADSLGDMCKALCPNAEVELFTYRASGEIEEAVSADGEAYTSLPNAFKFQKTFDPACGCKPPGQSWVQALAEAERALGRESRNDILVTAKKSDELARPKNDPRKRPKAGADPNAAAFDAAAERDAFLAGRAPTAGGATTGIAAGDGAKANLLAQGQGETREVTGPDGVKRRVRVIGLSR